MQSCPTKSRARLVALTYASIKLLEFPLVLLRGQRIYHSLVAPRFAQQFAVTLPSLGCNRTSDGASRLACVRAVTVPAVHRRRSDLLERLADAIFSRPELQFPHSGRVDERAALLARQ